MPADLLSTTFAALADPTRRAILARLAQGETSVKDLAEPFKMSPPAVTKHLKVLQRAGLIKYNRGHVFDPQSRRIGKVLSGDSKAIEKVAWRVGVVAIPYRACCAKVQTLFCLPPRIV